MLLFLLACSPSADSGGAATGSDARDSGEVEAPPLTAAEVGARLEAFFAAGVIDPEVIRAAYLEAMSHGDVDGCPGDALQLGEGVPALGCTSEDGYLFMGLSTYIDDGDSGWLLSGEFEIIDPEGRSFGAGGSAIRTYVEKDGRWFSKSSVGGSWQQEGGEGFLGEGFSGYLDYVGDSDDSWWVRSVIGAGSVGGDLSTYLPLSTAGSEFCTEHFAGLAQIRDALGRWYELELVDCSGCGQVSLEGVALGEVCVDLSGAVEEVGEMLDSAP